MNDENKKELFRMVKTVFAGYGKSAPDAETFDAFILFLKPFPMATIRAALAQHCDSSEFAPTAAVIARRCKELDGRPSADEAWSVALQGANEAETVVWTAETARAFFACKPILDAGDKIGARMAFRDAYNRLVADARTRREPVKWDVSPGTDPQRREAALQAAGQAGQIAYTPRPALPGPESETQQKKIAGKISALLARLKSNAFKEREKQRAAEIERRRLETEQRKSDIAEAVRKYGKESA